MSNIVEISVKKDLKEDRSHGDYRFPVDIHKDYFPSTDTGHYFPIPCHWHPEVELLMVTQGALHYQINLTEYDIKPGEAIFVNSNQLHSGYAMGENGTRAHSFIFHPSFFSGQEESLIYQKYVQPLLENTSFPAFHLTPEDEQQKHFLSVLESCYYLQKNRQDGWEMELLSNLTVCWTMLWKLSRNDDHRIPVSRKNSRDRQNIRYLLDYIKYHYKEKLTLDDLAGAAALSPGECGRLCKRVLHQTPMNYLLSYRIEKSIPYLVKHELSITEIALKVGFSSSSYYAEIFHRLKGVSPREFRNRIIR